MVARAEPPLETGVQNAPGFDDFELKLGDVMRGERATLGKSLLDVQRELRIRASYIAAIENCDLSAFDVQGFIAGHVRSYARYLGMDPDWCFRRFCEESGFQPLHGIASGVPGGSGSKPRRQPADMGEALANPQAIFIPQPEAFWSGIEPRAIGSMLVLILLVGGLGYGGWSVLREVQKVNLAPVDSAPGVIAVLDPAQDVSRGTPDADGTELAMNLPQPDSLDRIYRPKALDVPVLTRRDIPIAAIDPGLTRPDGGPKVATAAASGGAESAPEPTSSEDTAANALALAMGDGSQLAGAADSVRTVAPDAPTVELLAARPAWVRVTAPDGSVILEKTMDAGERFALPKLEMPPVLRTGNSGAVYFAVNGETFGPAAPGAQVVKNIELSPDALTERFALAEPDNDPELAKMIAVASAEAHADPETDSPEVRPED